MSLDYKNLAEKLRKFHESPEGKKSIERFRKMMQIKEERANNIWKFIESLSEQEYQIKLQSLIEWEEKFEEREYQKGKLKSSNVFNMVFDAIMENGQPYTDDNMFFGNGATYRGQQWIVYVGQGSFYTIEKNGERIFTST